MTSGESVAPRTLADRIRVLRIYHSAVVGPWRKRDRALRDLGVDEVLVTAKSWDEGGASVDFEAGHDTFVTASRTVGAHPNLFLYDPRPIWRLLKRGHFDLLDVHEEPCSLAMAEILVLRKLSRRSMPYVVYSAQNIYKRYPPPFRWVERWCLRHAAGAYPCNERAGEILEGKGLRSSVITLPLGVDLTHFAPVDRRPPTAPQLHVGYVGRLHSHKGVHVLLQALASLPEATAVIVGEGPDAERLQALARSLSVSERVRFRGHIDYRSLPDVYRTLDVIVIPSVPTPRWDEQFCRVAVEAMASGVPIVASRTGALPEVVGAAGILVPPGDPAALATALRELATAPDRWERLREAGLTSVGRFTWEVVAAGHHALYLACTSATRDLVTNPDAPTRQAS